MKSNPPPSVASSSKAAQTSAAKTSQHSIVPSPTKDAVKASPPKRILPPPDTPSSAKTASKKSQAKLLTATSSLLSPSKAPAAASKSETQLGKTFVKIPWARSSPAKPTQPISVVSSPSKVPAEISETLKGQKKSPVKATYLKPGVLSTGTAPAVRSKPQSQIGLASAQKWPQKRRLSSSPTSTSSSASESSGSSPSPSRPPSPSPAQPHVGTASKGKATQILPRDRVAANAKRSLSSSPVKVKGEPLHPLEAVGSPVALPKTPTSRVDVVRCLKGKLEEVRSSLRKSKACKMATSEQMTELDTIVASLIRVSEEN